MGDSASLWLFAQCLSRGRVVGLKLVFGLRTAGTNFTSPNSTIGIFFWLVLIFLLAFSNS